jgi:Fe-S cluster assembly iron-binding protein IscA
MLKVTEEAKKELKKTLAEKVDNPLAGLRIMKGGKPDQYDLAIDVEMPGDQVVEFKGSKVLLVAQELSEHLGGHILDVEDDGHRKHLVVLGGDTK